MALLNRVVSLVAVGLLVFAPTAAADPGDDSFYNEVSAFGIPVTREKAIIEAHAVCDTLGQPNMTMDNVAQAIAVDNSDWSIDDAYLFVGAAAGTYCPQYSPDSQPHGG